MNKNHNQHILSDYLNELQFAGKLNKFTYQNGNKLYELGKCHLLSSTPNEYYFEVDDDYQDFNVSLQFSEKQLETQCDCGATNTCTHIYACLQQTQHEMSRSFLANNEQGLQYSREGMIKRVLEERRKRALQESYHIEFAENIHGEHILTTTEHKKYELSFYDFDKNLGYCSCPDYQTNKLETCKHLIYAFDQFEKTMGHNELPNQPYPFLEIFRHPLFDYQISWYYPQKIDLELKKLLQEYFDENQIWKSEKWSQVHQFIEQAKAFKLIKIRQEVITHVENYYESVSLSRIYEQSEVTKNVISPKLFPYQHEGALFVASRKGSFLADEIGLGKSAQALSAAVLKIKYLHFKQVHIICPEELKTNWNSEIIKWVPEAIRKQFIIYGMGELASIGACDFLIVDEAQKIDDYESGLVGELNRLDYKHIVLVTDSKYESSLMKFHAVSTLIDKHMLTPLWELSYKHCLFDPNIPEKTIAYHHLELVGKRIEKFYLRRERTDVFNQLPPSNLIEISVALNPHLKSEQSELAKKLVDLCKKEDPNKYDWMRFRDYLKEMIFISSFNYSKKYQASFSPKMREFIHFVLHKLNLGEDQKVVVFAEGKDLQNQIIRALNEERIQAGVYNKDDEFDKNRKFLITEEGNDLDFLFAHHFVYFNIPQNPALIERRMSLQQKKQKGIEQSLFYFIKSVESFESLIFDWQKRKPYFVDQLLTFIFNSLKQKDLSLRLREELAHEMKDFILEKSQNEFKEIQTDLFGNEIKKIEKPSKSTVPTIKSSHSEMQAFFDSMINSWKFFEKLDLSQKQILKSGSIQVENQEGEIVIRIRKK